MYAHVAWVSLNVWLAYSIYREGVRSTRVTGSFKQPDGDAVKQTDPQQDDWALSNVQPTLQPHFFIKKMKQIRIVKIAKFNPIEVKVFISSLGGYEEEMRIYLIFMCIWYVVFI
jgi:hypothetical protein